MTENRINQLDSREKLKYYEYFGHKTDDISSLERVLLEHEESLDKKYTGEQMKKIVPIKEVIKKFLVEDKLMEVGKLNWKDLDRITDYLSEFQTKKSDLSKDTEIKSRKIKGVSWSKQLHAENCSRNVRKANNRPTWNGVGSYMPQKPEREKTRPNRGFGIGNRFAQRNLSCGPGPGTYGNDQNLHRPERTVKKATTPIPPFEWGPSRKELKLPERLPPNIYKLENNTITSTINKQVTKRGPYDISTGPRDNSTIKNHFSVPVKLETKSWPLIVPGVGDSNSHKFGTWGTIPRKLELADTDPTHLAPNHYQEDVMKPKVCKPNVHPFNCSQRYIRGNPIRKYSTPGPGRYDIGKKEHSVVPPFARSDLRSRISERWSGSSFSAKWSLSSRKSSAKPGWKPKKSYCNIIYK